VALIEGSNTYEDAFYAISVVSPQRQWIVRDGADYDLSVGQRYYVSDIPVYWCVSIRLYRELIEGVETPYIECVDEDGYAWNGPAQHYNVMS
jgi:hypothetical protein